LFVSVEGPPMKVCTRAPQNLATPLLVKDKYCLEQIQRRATKLVKGFRKLKYEERLKRLVIYSSEKRRLRDDLIETFKILRGK